mgnify:CR=1 FL=1
MKEISILSQLDAHLLFSVPNQPAFFLLPVSQAERINDLSFEWFEDYVPFTASTCLRTAAFGTM